MLKLENILKFDRTESLEFQEKMVHLGMCGLSMKECGDYFGLDPEDWLEWCQEHPIAEARLNCGRAHGIALAGEKLIGEVKSSKFMALAFYLKTQGNFTEKTITKFEDITKDKPMPIPPLPVDPVEAMKAYKEFIQNS